MTSTRRWRAAAAVPAVALPAVALLVLLPAGGQASAGSDPGPVPEPPVGLERAPAPAFDPTATTLTWSGDTALVRFVERGLLPEEAVQISVVVQVAVEWSCVDPASGLVLLRSSSSASSAVEETWTAGAEGVVAGEVPLHVRAGTLEVTGLPCELRTSRTSRATVTDLTHSVSLQLDD